MKHIYETEYSSKFIRPQTTVTTRSVVTEESKATSGFGSNNSVSPLELNVLEDRKLYQNTLSHEMHSRQSSIINRPQTDVIHRAVMERSGYWGENTSLSKAQKDSAEPIATTNAVTFKKTQSSHERFWKIDKQLIGKKEANSFTRQHIFAPKSVESEYVSTEHTAYMGKQINRGISIPNNTVIEDSGFSKSTFPTKSSVVPLSDISPSDLHPIELKRMKYRNTIEYQNLFNPNPYVSINHLNYQPTNTIKERARTAMPMTRKGNSGYCSNSIVHAGPPGDPKTFKTGKTESSKAFKNPELGFRGHIQATPNVMEKSGFWGN